MTTSRAIQRLDDLTVAQIRAGESIEHPAAVVKEAIENAIDAGATTIRVEIRAGGKREIRITDNGSGIPADQIELAFERHTTSKLRQADDLFAVVTLGFRGEALASMAAVAQVTCVSRSADADVGTEVRLARGKVISRAPRGIPPGTTLIIQNLFGEVPVRLKFLKGDAAEAARVTEVIQHAALARPQIRWTLLSDGREQLQTSGSGDVRDVMLTLYGPEVVRDLLPVTDQDGNGELATRVSGWISRPGRTLGTRKGMHLFINGRPIQAASAIGAAVQDAYFHQLQSGRFPYACLAIEVDPGAVDVNIHPSKRDVKLQFNDRVIGLIGRAVRTTLSEDAAPMPADAGMSPPTPARAPVADEHEDEPAAGPSELEPRVPRAVTRPHGPRTAPLPPLARLEQAVRSIGAAELVMQEAPAPAPPPAATGDVSRPAQTPGTERQPEPAHPSRTAPKDLVMAREPVRGRDVRAAGQVSEDVIAPRKPSPPKARADEHSVAREQPREQETAGCSALPDLRLIGQHEQTWILASAAGRLYVIDQHRAHERVLYEHLLQEGRDQPLPQHEVVPQEVALPPALADLLATRRRELAAVGLAITPAATGRIVVSAAPPMLDGADLQAVLLALGSGLPTGSRGVGAGWRDHVLATIACHSSIRPGQALSFAEMQKLLEELQQCATPEVCPHGHAVMATITTTWLEQQFDRSGQVPRERQEGAGVRMAGA